MRSILFSADISSSKRANTNSDINKNIITTRDLIYSDCNNFNADICYSDIKNRTNLIKDKKHKHNDCLTERSHLIQNNHDYILNLKNQSNYNNVFKKNFKREKKLDTEKAVADANSDYKQSVAYAKMGIVMASVIVATT